MLIVILVIVFLIVVLNWSKYEGIDEIEECLPMFIVYKHKNGVVGDYMCYPCDKLPEGVNSQHFMTCNDLYKSFGDE